ncbi:N-acetyl-gamma-glutamyl-phosphate reductase [Tumebacillus algifaecis]|uniref:N-acetyl-gamma-glutamyl-phosphate reductase n=1 Tax=Tumebacillus algifaecis TaxID=1214604 RepID=A0A223D5P0_9BACL|nr:N-acetyl-gamma-glutamyl-phosphate reductase [Tumebacillus algifaecis]ASS76797.1 N-acetyl-gamma-glutamyl-phosphate reductase [Tumebacillus algifaecis]
MNVAVIGATGYTGLEVVRLLMQHPELNVTAITSDSQAGAMLTEVYPHLQGLVHEPLQRAEAMELALKADLAFVALPSGLSTGLVPELLGAGLKVIDLAGDHRLSQSDYEQWYQKTPPSAEVLAQAVYGLPEYYADQIATARLIANPGCYPTATLLSLLPLVQQGLIDPDTLIVDAKSGVSGAGKAVSPSSHFVEVNENFKAYKVGVHQHIPEIEGVLSQHCGEKVTLSFTTHLVPMTRGILTTSYAKLTSDVSTEELLALYQETYRDQPFVRIREKGNMPATKDVSTSNFCDIGLRVDPRTKRVTVIGVIDNLIKGAAGQAIQNANLLCGLPQTTGLRTAPVYF